MKKLSTFIFHLFPRSGIQLRWTSLKGFTLIELIVVFTLIGILATFTFSSIENSLAKARDAKRKDNLRQIQTALQLYYNDNGRYPIQGPTNSSGNIPWITDLTQRYIKDLPIDPVNSCTNKSIAPHADANCYVYFYVSGGFCNLMGQGYILSTRLEAYPNNDLGQKNIVNPTNGNTCIWPNTDVCTGDCLRSIYTVVNP